MQADLFKSFINSMIDIYVKYYPNSVPTAIRPPRHTSAGSVTTECPIYNSLLREVVHLCHDYEIAGPLGAIYDLYIDIDLIIKLYGSIDDKNMKLIYILLKCGILDFSDFDNYPDIKNFSYYVYEFIYIRETFIGDMPGLLEYLHQMPIKYLHNSFVCEVVKYSSVEECPIDYSNILSDEGKKILLSFAT